MKENRTLEFNQFVNLISENLRIDSDLNTPRSTHRFVQHINDVHISVFIGISTIIHLTFESLYECYLETIRNNGIYNKNICQTILPNQTRNHGCTVHVIGMIFVKLGLMTQISERNYHIIKD
jgi:hypothetical protein